MAEEGEELPSETAEKKDDYIDELTGLKEPQSAMMFSSSGAVLTIEDPNLHPMGKAIAIFVLFICMLGFLNGLDYASADEGLVRPDEFVYRLSLTAPDETATFRGTVSDHTGEFLVNATVYVSWDEGGIWNYSEVLTGASGEFEFDRLDPGLARVDIIVERDGKRDVLANRVLLSPPAMIEPIGFTELDFIVPSQEDFAAAPCSNGAEECEIRNIDRTVDQMEHPLMDPGAASVYITIGFGFMGLALIAAGFTVWALKTGSLVVLRTAAGLSFFGMGHYYSACLFGLVALGLSFAVPRPRIPLVDNRHNG
ncbi:MAG: carboxypeptidase-like regulatory domain-containing protein [Candidatus Poseidoniaceae archaeon]|nr:carboxypeptidase-like regulatory domain-containing protein [Candidatus Poseidoniaceae archaeon]